MKNETLCQNVKKNILPITIEASTNSYPNVGEWPKRRRLNVRKRTLRREREHTIMRQLTIALNRMKGGELEEPITFGEKRLLSSQCSAMYSLSVWGRQHVGPGKSLAVCTGVTRRQGHSCSVPSKHKIWLNTELVSLPPDRVARDMLLR